MDANMQSVLGNMHGRIGTAAYPLRVHTWSEDRVHANKQTIWNQKSMYMEELYMAKVKDHAMVVAMLRVYGSVHVYG